MLSRQNKTWSGMSHTMYPVAKPMLRRREMTDLWGAGGHQRVKGLCIVSVSRAQTPKVTILIQFLVPKIIALQLWLIKCWRKQCQQQERKERRGLVFYAHPTRQVPTQAYAPSLFPLVVGPLSVSAYRGQKGEVSERLTPPKKFSTDSKEKDWGSKPTQKILNSTSNVLFNCI